MHLQLSQGLSKTQTYKAVTSKSDALCDQAIPSANSI